MSHDDDTCPHLVVLGLLEAENARLKAEVDAVRKYWKATGEDVNRYVGKSIALEDEIARLKAEVERLTLASQGAVKYVDHTMALTRQSMEHHKQVSRLEAQVERLTKAVMHSPAAQLKLKELEGKTTYEEINPKGGQP